MPIFGRSLLDSLVIRLFYPLFNLSIDSLRLIHSGQSCVDSLRWTLAYSHFTVASAEEVDICGTEYGVRRLRANQIDRAVI